MKILFITPTFPYPPDRGDRVRCLHLIRGISRQNKVVLLSFVRPEELSSVARLDCCSRLETVPFSSAAGRKRSSINVFSTIPQQIYAYRSNAFRQKIGQIIEEENPDIIHAHSLQMAPYAAGYRIPKVLDLVETVTLMYKRMLAHRRDVLSLVYRLELSKVRRYESKVVADFDKVIVMSEPIKEFLARLSSRENIGVVRVGVDTDYFSSDNTQRVKNRIVFMGTMTFYQNVDAILYFYKDILPLIKKEIPDVSLTLVGGNPPDVIRRLENDPLISVTGYVDDVRPYLASASVFISPLRITTGLHVKILEAMAAGLPVVATSRSFEGSLAKNGRDVLIADTADDFAGQVIRLLTDDDLHKTISTSGQNLVKEHYSVTNSADDLEKIYKEIANLKGKRGEG